MVKPIEGSKTTRCGYDGRRKRLPDGRCAACGRTAYEGALEAVADSSIKLLNALACMNKLSWTAPAGTGAEFSAARRDLRFWVAELGIR